MHIQTVNSGRMECNQNNSYSVCMKQNLLETHSMQTTEYMHVEKHEDLGGRSPAILLGDQCPLAPLENIFLDNVCTCATGITPGRKCDPTTLSV